MAPGTSARRRRRCFMGNTSPAKRTTRRLARGPGRAAADKGTWAEGTEYHTVSFRSRTTWAIEAPKLASPVWNRCTEAPARAAAYRSKTDKSKWNGAWLHRRSSWPMSKRPTAHSTNARALRWVSITPFGDPVEPDVYRR